MNSGYKFKDEIRHIEEVKPQPAPRLKVVTRAERQFIGRCVGGTMIWAAANSLIYVFCAWNPTGWGWDGEHSVQLASSFHWWQPIAVLVLFLVNIGILGCVIVAINDRPSRHGE